MLAALAMAAMLALTCGGAVVGSVVVARHRAQAVADLGALAAANRLMWGPEAACATAAGLAAAMRATVSACTVTDLDVVVVAEVPVRLGRWGVHAARASARAGPV